MDDSFDKDFNLLVNFLRSRADDRTIAIVLAAYAEKYLGELIRFRLTGLNRDLKIKMFHPSHGSLGGLAARIDMAKALDQIDTSTYNDLKVLASIRNRFAHDLSVMNCDDPQIAKRVANFSTRKYVGISPEKQKQRDEEWKREGNSVKLQVAGMMLCSSLHTTFTLLRHMQPKSSA